MTRYPNGSQYCPPHDCYSQEFTWDYEKESWVCPKCGVKYIPPLSRHAVIKKPQITYFSTHPWATPVSKLYFNRGQVFWRPEKDYSNHDNNGNNGNGNGHKT